MKWINVMILLLILTRACTGGLTQTPQNVEYCHHLHLHPLQALFSPFLPEPTTVLIFPTHISSAWSVISYKWNHRGYTCCRKLLPLRSILGSFPVACIISLLFFGFWVFFVTEQHSIVQVKNFVYPSSWFQFGFMISQLLCTFVNTFPCEFVKICLHFM